MAKFVPITPALPYPGRGQSFRELATFDQDLVKALFTSLSDLAQRANGSLPKDGTEAMTGGLNMGGFNISNVAGSNFRAYTGDPIASLTGGSTFGSVIDGRSSSHLVLGIRDNDANDSVSVVSFNGTGDYSRRVLSARADGRLEIFGQLVFPATQQASTDPNTLDDYEEGTWTPTIAFGGGSTGITYGTRLATYTKIGNMVNAEFDITLTAKGTSTGNAEVHGWPFSAATLNASGVIGFYTGMAAIGATITTTLVGGVGTLRQSTGAATIATLTDANFTNTTRIIGSVVYNT